MTLENSTAKVKIGGSMSDSFNIVSGQIDALSDTLFDIVLHEVLKDTIKTGSIIYKSWEICDYIDDIVLMTRNENYMREAFCIIELKGQTMGFKINDRKTKYMKLSSSETRRKVQNITI